MEYKHAKPNLVQIKIPKNDTIRDNERELILYKLGREKCKIEQIKGNITFLYAPSCVLTDEWKNVIELFRDLPVNLVFKAYPYYRQEKNPRNSTSIICRLLKIPVSPIGVQ